MRELKAIRFPFEGNMKEVLVGSAALAKDVGELGRSIDETGSVDEEKSEGETDVGGGRSDSVRVGERSVDWGVSSGEPV